MGSFSVSGQEQNHILWSVFGPDSSCNVRYWRLTLRNHIGACTFDVHDLQVLFGTS